LYISTKNLSINWVLKHKREKTFHLDNTLVEFKSIYSDPEQLLITAEMLKRIQFAIKQLPPKCQLIFKLIKEDGLKYKQVAALLDLSIKTIEHQMSIALRKIGFCIQFDMAKTVSPH
jgi:RNA polymerase sigma-70 factor (ECF subfamily)